MSTLDAGRLRAEFRALGLAEGAVVMAHSSLSAFGRVAGGANTVVRALLDCVGETGTLVVPTFTGDVVTDPGAGDARHGVPLFHEDMPTSMGAIASAVLAWPGRKRSGHPQASVAAVGKEAGRITATQPLGYAVGTGSPFDVLHALRADILLLGVGHNRNTFLHYAESRVPHHRRKVRRFPYLVEGQRVWVETDDVGDDNGTHFPRIGAEYEETGAVRTRTIGEARCRLLATQPFIAFAVRRLDALLADGRPSP
ncbi:aminoglycoside N(3)-acetyltransferase [Amycolatopsis sp. CA-230715]|uniref:aminoglycoside N(3)-acetyltransferase n=1 Tax=Amycolatopsis sp. CA-230715 TaxID=2745196 RepID=UPI001C0188F8|nr:AAC(3) family N-acetyltransferase [Amycolatopsis sp. CA-230715]QWF85229.1 SPBc2 prophage-derived aminoglycoside N(3')-acetyltransferase-like protein YokD [Amycolatopsis sp. CA-230715]